MHVNPYRNEQMTVTQYEHTVYRPTFDHDTYDTIQGQ